MVVEFWMIVKTITSNMVAKDLQGKTFSAWERPFPAVPIESLQEMVNGYQFKTGTM